MLVLGADDIPSAKSTNLREDIGTPPCDTGPPREVPNLRTRRRAR